MRYLYIAGTDFCGSTLLDRLFWMVPGVAAPGELHWLVDIPVEVAHSTRAGMKVTRLCTRHGPGCAALPADFVNRGFIPGNLYPTVAKQLNCDVLVSSDKSWLHFLRFAAHHDAQVLVLFKNPRAQSASFAHNEGRSTIEGLAIWQEFYAHALFAFPDAVYVEYEQLAQEPNATMQRLCKTLKLSTWENRNPTNALFEQDFHHIGGNPGAHQDAPIEVQHREGGTSNAIADRLLTKLRSAAQAT